MGLFNLFSSSKKTQRQSQQSEAQLQLDMFDNLRDCRLILSVVDA